MDTNEKQIMVYAKEYIDDIRDMVKCNLIDIDYMPNIMNLLIKLNTTINDGSIYHEFGKIYLYGKNVFRQDYIRAKSFLLNAIYSGCYLAAYDLSILYYKDNRSVYKSEYWFNFYRKKVDTTMYYLIIEDYIA